MQAQGGSKSAMVSSNKFQAGMRLEAKDRQHPTMICVATITKVDANGRLLIHFDGWGNSYDYWCEPSTTDIHPMGWCKQTKRSLHKPYGTEIFVLCRLEVIIALCSDSPGSLGNFCGQRDPGGKASGKMFRIGRTIDSVYVTSRLLCWSC